MTEDAAFAKTPVVKLHTLVVVVLSLAACGKANDLPAIKAETEGMMKNYQVRLDDLNRRADSIMQRGNAIGVTNPDAQNASRMFAQAKGKLEQLRGNVGNAAGEMGKLKDKLELRRYFDRMKRELEVGTTEINADFDAVESWITLAEAQPKQVSSRQPVVPPPAPDSPPAGNPGQTDATNPPR